MTLQEGSRGKDEPASEGEVEDDEDATNCAHRDVLLRFVFRQAQKPVAGRSAGKGRSEQAFDRYENHGWGGLLTRGRRDPNYLSVTVKHVSGHLRGQAPDPGIVESV